MAATGYGAASNLTGGLLSDVMQGLVPGFSGGGLLDSRPQAAPAQAAPTAPASVVAQAPSAPTNAAPPTPQAYTDQDQITQLIAQNRPNRLQTLLHAWGTGQDFNSAQADLTKRNIANALLPQQIAESQREFQYGAGIQDPALRNLYFTNPAAYAEIEKQRLGQTKVDKDTTVYGAGPNGDQTYNGSVTLNQGQTLTNTAGANIRHIPAAPIPMAPSSSLGNGDTGKIIPGSTAPAKPEVVTTPAGSSSNVVYPGAPTGGRPSVPPPAAPSFNLGSVQSDPTAFFGGVFGKPITISSGARTPQHNAAVGGVPNSAHLSDQAWDIPNLGMPAQAVAARLKAAGVPFDQIIDEGDHTHISLAPKARGIVLAGRNGQYQLLSGGNSQPQGGTRTQSIRQGATPHQLLTPEERAAHGILPSDRAGYALKPDGTVEKTAEDDFGPERQAAYTKNVLEFEPLKNYITTRGFLDAAKQSMKQKGGFADLNLIDMAGKSVNPTIAMRPNMIVQFGHERGWSDELIGKVRATMEHGQALDDAARNALYNTIYTNTRAHYNAAKGMISKVNRDAAKYGLTPQDLIPDLQEMPDEPPPSYGGRGGNRAPGGGTPQQGNAQQQALAAAKAAIQRGAPRAAVIARLRQNGVNPAGL